VTNGRGFKPPVKKSKPTKKISPFSFQEMLENELSTDNPKAIENAKAMNQVINLYRGKQMKTIIVEWKKEESIYGYAMRVTKSDHKRFVEGSRFDFGFFEIATREGYTIISFPGEKGGK
jgi:hypothetical protein